MGLLFNSDPLPWLTKRVSEWESHADYNKVKAFVSTVKVVNDSAERAVALATDYYKVLIISRPRVARAGTNKLKCRKNPHWVLT